MTDPLVPPLSDPGDQPTHALDGWLVPPGLSARYDVIGRLGAGGMGVVYKARDRETGAIVALKLIHPSVGGQPGVIERFKAELLLARQITHKNVCRVYDLFRFDDVLVIAMEFIEGERLRDVITRKRRLSIAETLEIARQVIAALREAHAQGIVHRDIKPENIMIARDGTVRLMDFGLARSADSAHTTAGAVMGTPAYMAPEQAEGRPVDRRTDIYALGLLLYEMLTGQAAFSGDSAITVAMKQVRDAPQPPASVEPTISGPVEQVILRALEKDPAKRFQTVDELEDALTRAGTGPAHDLRAGPVPVSPAHDLRAGTRTGTGPAHDLRAGTRTGTGPAHDLRAGPVPVSARWLTLGAVAAVVLAVAAAAVLLLRRPVSIEIPFQKFTLDNGLRVLISEDHSAPTFSIVVSYNVGSRDERPGKTGYAHLFEHLMFAGSLNVGKGEHFLLVMNNGGSMNGIAQPDSTMYFETLPANQLDLALFLEADRMHALVIDQGKLDNVRSTVIQERTVSVENRPYGGTFIAIADTAYDNFGYKHPMIGSVEDLNAASVDDLKEFFRIYYAPSNAVLTLVGDVKPVEALTRIKKYFGNIPKQPPPPVSDVTEPEQRGERRRVIEDAFAPTSRLDIVYKTPPSDTPEMYALHAAATILAFGQSSRLYQKLVNETEVAATVTGGVQLHRGPSLVIFTVMPRQGKELAQIEKLMYDEIDRLGTGPIPRTEIDRIRMQYRRQIAQQYHRTLARATELAEDEVLFGRPALINERTGLIDRVTAEDVQRAARTYLTPSRRSVILTVPSHTSAPPAAPPPAADKSVPVSRVERKGRAPVSNEVLRVKLPVPVETVLDNGLTVIVLEDHRLPAVAAQLNISGAGSLYEPPDLPGLASITAQMLRQGSTSRSSKQLAEDIDNLGATLNVGATFGSSATTLTASGLSDNFDAWFGLAADVLLHPVFPVDELNALKQRTKAQVRQSRASPAFLANEQFSRALFGSHPAHVTATTPQALDAMSSDTLAKWYAEAYAPQNAILTIAGDVKASQVIRKVREQLGRWPRTGRKEVLAPNPVPATAAKIFLVDRPNSAQTTLMAGNIAIDRRDPDYLPVLVMNQVIGGDISGRLPVNLREERGYTYNISTAFTAFKYPGAWRVATDVRADATEDALRQILLEARRLAGETVPQDELEAAKRSLAARFALSLEDPAQWVTYAGTRKIYGFSADYWDTYPAKIMAVSANDVQRVAQKYINPDAFVIVAVGDRRTIERALARFGRVDVFDTDGRPIK